MATVRVLSFVDSKILSGFFVFVCVVLGFELRAYTLSHSTSPFFIMGFFKIGSRELFAWAGLEPCSFCSLPTE
jgi:hypothetical protein